jgi:hypothetical protein
MHVVWHVGWMPEEESTTVRTRAIDTHCDQSMTRGPTGACEKIVEKDSIANSLLISRSSFQITELSRLSQYLGYNLQHLPGLFD